MPLSLHHLLFSAAFAAVAADPGQTTNWILTAQSTRDWGPDANIYACTGITPFSNGEPGVPDDELCNSLESTGVPLDKSTVLRLSCLTKSSGWSPDIYLRNLTDFENALRATGTVANIGDVECSFDEGFSDSKSGSNCLSGGNKGDRDGFTYWNPGHGGYGWELHGATFEEGPYMVGRCNNEVNRDSRAAFPLRVYVGHPSLPPVPTPWDIEFVNMTADFSLNSTDELTLNYQIGKGRNYTFPLFKECGVPETSVTNGLVSVTDKKSDGKDSVHDLLTLSYNFNKTAIASSNTWNATGNIQFCQKVQLYAGSYRITEDVRAIDIKFDLDVNFNFTNGLGGATTKESNESASVDGYVTAFKCDGPEFNTSTSPLVPNEKLFVCIKSVSDEVVMDNLESMIISQGAASLNVITNTTVAVPSITSRTYDGQTKVWVSTRVPINTFNYDSDASITVSGKVVMKFVDGSGRKLQADIGTEVASASQESSFELEVKLQGEEMDGDVGVLMNPGNVVAADAFALLGVIVASAFALW